SILVDRLLDLAPVALTVLDVSPAALNRAKSRLGARARSVNWIESDVTLIESVGEFDFWHDRAVFHFLTDREDRSGYTELARRSLVPGGCAVIATFAPSGPSQCSALPVIRYDATSLPAEFGDGFELIDYREVRHLTPWGAPQQFSYFKLQKATARNCIAPGWSKPRPD
ncbi:MAG: class I SAM-dependent methyltransferase, partial [Tepidisphaeraceae bacterium]